MTCKEKFMDAYEDDIERYCPSDFGWLRDPEYCCEGSNKELCDKCWDREYPEELDEGITECIVVKVPRPSIAETAEVKKAESTIEDSGDRTQFESGAVRDMREGKGRFDVAPLEVMSDMLGTKDTTHDPILLDIATFMYEHDTGWLHAALCNFAERAYDGCIPTMLLDVAKHYEEGAKKYSPDNWRKSIPVWCYIDSAVRHYLKWLRGDTNEHHNRAFCWNLMCCIWEVEYGQTWREAKGYSNKEN